MLMVLLQKMYAQQQSNTFRSESCQWCYCRKALLISGPCTQNSWTGYGGLVQMVVILLGEIINRSLFNVCKMISITLVHSFFYNCCALNLWKSSSGQPWRVHKNTHFQLLVILPLEVWIWSLSVSLLALSSSSSSPSAAHSPDVRSPPSETNQTTPSIDVTSHVIHMLTLQSETNQATPSIDVTSHVIHTFSPV